MPALPEVSGLSLDTRRLVAVSIVANTAKAYTAVPAGFETWLGQQCTAGRILSQAPGQYGIAIITEPPGTGKIATKPHP